MLVDVVRGWIFIKFKGCYWDIYFFGMVLLREFFMLRIKVILGGRYMFRI